MSKSANNPAKPFASVKEPTTGPYNGRLMSLAFDYTLSCIKPFQMDYFFRWLIQRLANDSLEDAEAFIDFVHNKIAEKQPNLRQTLISVVKKYKAVQRVQREEQKNGIASLDSRLELTDASKKAEAAIESANV